MSCDTNLSPLSSLEQRKNEPVPTRSRASGKTFVAGSEGDAPYRQYANSRAGGGYPLFPDENRTEGARDLLHFSSEERGGFLVRRAYLCPPPAVNAICEGIFTKVELS